MHATSSASRLSPASLLGDVVKNSLIPLRFTPLSAPAQGAAKPASPPRLTPSSGSLTRPGTTPERPANVSALSWELLAIHVEDAQRRSSIAYAPLRVVVQTVVRELRLSGETWESIYAALHSAVVPVAGGASNWTIEYEMHTSRSAALVAHMHSWADVERLAEIEGDVARDGR